MCALNVAVIVHLNAFWRSIQTKNLGYTFKQLGLPGCFRQPTVKCIARIGHGMVNDLLFLPPLRVENIHFFATPERQCFYQQSAFRQRMVHQNLGWARLVIIKLDNKCGQDIRRGLILRMGGKKGATSIVASTTHKKDLNAGLPRFLPKTEHIRILQGGRVDHIGILHLRQCANTVTQNGGTFKIQCFSRPVHIRSQRVPQGGVLTG